MTTSKSRKVGKGHWKLFYLILLFCVGTQGIQAKPNRDISVVVQPAQGTLKYPSVAEGLRQNLMYQLGSLSHVTVKEEQATDFDVALNYYFEESPAGTKVTVRAYDGRSGYHIRTLSFNGTYGDIAAFGQSLLSASISILGVASNQKQMERARARVSQDMGALHQIGLGAALKDEAPLEALEKFAEAKKIEPNLELSGSMLKSTAQDTLASLRAPEDLGEAYHYMNAPGLAQKSYDRALETNPKNVKALIGKAEMLMNKGQYALARGLLVQAVNNAPKNLRALYLLGWAESKANRLDQGINLMAKAIGEGYETAEAYRNLAMALERKGDRKLAAKYYQRAGEQAQQVINLKEAELSFQKGRALNPTLYTDQQQVQLLIQLGKLDAAVKLLNQRISAGVHEINYLSMLGYIYILQDQPEKARRFFERALKSDPNDFEANYYLGYLLQDDPNQMKRAIRLLENAVVLRPEVADATYLLSKLYLADGQGDKATDLLKSLISLRPRDGFALTLLGDGYLMSGNFALAENVYRKALDFMPNHIYAQEGLARLYIKLGQKDLAIAAISAVFKIDAIDNLFTSPQGKSILQEITHPALIDWVRAFPKTVTDPLTGDTSIVSNIHLLQLDPGQWWWHVKQKYLSLYVLDEKRLAQDISLAVFSAYHLVGDQTLPPSLLKENFESKATMGESLKKWQVNAALGYYPAEQARNKDVDQVSIYMAMATAADRGLYIPRNPENLPPINYQKGSILRLNYHAFGAYALILWFALGLPLAIYAFYRRRRGFGTVKVYIEYDPRYESFLTVKLSKKPEEMNLNDKMIVRDKHKHHKRRFKNVLKQKGTWVKEQAGKETVFHKVPAREYYCNIFGTIEDVGLIRETVGNYQMAQRFVLEKNSTKEIVFKLKKEEAYVTIWVTQGDQCLTGAQIRIDGLEDVLFTKGEQGAYCYLKPGSYDATITYQDKGLRQKIDILNLEDQSFYFDVQSFEEKFQNKSDAEKNEAAKTLEKEGNLDQAAQLYQQTGEADKVELVYAEADLKKGNYQAAVKHLVKAKAFLRAAEIFKDINETEKMNVMYAYHHINQSQWAEAESFIKNTHNYKAQAKVYKELGRAEDYERALAEDYFVQGNWLDAAQHFSKAQEFERAAQCYEKNGDKAKAASLYAKAGQFDLAGEYFASMGDSSRAALAFEKAGRWDEAIELYEKLGEEEKLIAILIQSERYLEAGRRQKEQGFIDAAIDILSKAPEHATQYAEVQVLLGVLYFEKGLHPQAVNTLEPIYEVSEDHFDNAGLYAYARSLAETEQAPQAKAVFEMLLKRDFHYRDVADRVAQLNDLLQAAESQGGGVSIHAQTVSAATPIARYEVLSELGRGAMGIVYQARDRQLDRTVALKMLPHSLAQDPEALASLKNEAQTAARLNHPHIVTVFDMGQQNGEYYIAMEYVEGQPFDQILKKMGKLNLKSFFAIAKPLCDVLAFAHAQRVIHRDIKPSNVIVHPPTKTVKLMDFGLAKVLKTMAVDKTMLRGTPLYMSPEQITGKDIDHRTDIYSLGVVFYECLAGRPPFTEGDIMYAHLNTPPQNIRELNSELPASLAQGIMACLAKDKSQRPHTASDLWQSIFSHLAGAKKAV